MDRILSKMLLMGNCKSFCWDQRVWILSRWGVKLDAGYVQYLQGKLLVHIVLLNGGRLLIHLAVHLAAARRGIRRIVRAHVLLWRLIIRSVWAKSASLVTRLILIRVGWATLVIVLPTLFVGLSKFTFFALLTLYLFLFQLLLDLFLILHE